MILDRLDHVQPEPLRSCDITPLDFYLWGYVKSKCFVDKPATIEALEANITEVISEIPTEVLERVIQNWCLRIKLFFDVFI